MFARREDRLWLHVLLSISAVLILVAIDNHGTILHDLSKPGAWAGILICSVILLFGQALVREVILARYHGKYKTGWSCSAGITLGVILLYGLLYLFRG